MQTHHFLNNGFCRDEEAPEEIQMQIYEEVGNRPDDLPNVVDEQKALNKKPKTLGENYYYTLNCIWFVADVINKFNFWGAGALV